MQNNETLISSSSISIAESLLRQRIDDIFGPSVAIVCTPDGMIVASAANDPETNARHAALTSALFSLSNSFCAELLRSENKEISLTSEKGQAVIVVFFADKHPFFLCLTSSTKTNLATLLRLSKDTGEQLKGIIQLNQTGEQRAQNSS
ncbi:roadblock/LC7 domain-containing protein [Alcanivorax sp.]|uniref:roadblock/LC7 domain-containing protein n=1 Tax=Alcanivorax sp. TaxID=1872427 RepID=UPI0032D8BCB1